MLDRLQPQPADALLALIKLHAADPRTDKIDLGVGVYRTGQGDTPVFGAIKAAERRLLDYKRKQRGEVKPHDESFAGQVTQLYPQEDHGFLLTHEGTQLYFHRNSLMQRDFDALKVGDRVHFVETVGDTGPIASKVWRAEGEPG
jgi:aspartate/tyrosine/aromatic aminotransferase